MKRSILIAALVLSFVSVIRPAVQSEGRRGASDRGENKGRGDRGIERPHQPRVLIRMQRVNVPRPSPVQKPEHVVRDGRHVAFPSRDEKGREIFKEASRVPPAHHMEIAPRTEFVRSIESRERMEKARNHYYWHEDGRVRYAHYYDHYGIHWYGFYHGPTFYWTRYYVGRWWWWDVNALRWVYWWSGYWWWNGPGGVEYVYVNNGYYPYQSGGVVTVKSPELQAPPASVPQPQQGAAYDSSDGSRLVQVFGPRFEAFLYDKSSGQPVYLKYLSQNVAGVKYSGGTSSQPLEILLTFKDGTFAVFDGNGTPLESPVTSETPSAGASEQMPPTPPPNPSSPTPDAAGMPDASSAAPQVNSN